MIFLYSGPVLALLSALLFGISPVLIKAMIGEMPVVLMAGVLYLGSGIGLLFLRLLRREPILKNISAIPSPQKLKLAGAIISGGILAPVCLVYGIRYSPAFQVSALLNLETVATTIIAGFIFHEHVSKRVWFGKILILLGAFLISLTGSSFHFSKFSLFTIVACIFWGVDNNLTRDIEDLPPELLAGIKGFCAGIFNIALALILHQTSNQFMSITMTMAIGAMSYGLSLVFFVYALRKIGTSRTSTYFASGPFIGMIAAVIFLGERPAWIQWLAGISMLIGLYVLYRENHDHEHIHEEISHRHLHVHDEHHQHEHDGTKGPEPHEHLHRHKRLIHSHPHLPDIHHRHQHL